MRHADQPARRSVRRPPLKLGRPAGVDSDETYARILAAARDCFGTVGYSRATNALIGQLAGVTAASLYHYHASKAELFVAVGRDTAARIEEAQLLAIRSAPTLREKLASLVEAFVEIVRADPRLAQFLVVWSLELDRQPELVSDRQRVREATLRFYERLTDDAKVRGELPDEADPRALSDGVESILLGLSLMASRELEQEPFSVDEEEESASAATSPRLIPPLLGAGNAISAWIMGTYFGPARRPGR